MEFDKVFSSGGSVYKLPYKFSLCVTLSMPVFNADCSPAYSCGNKDSVTEVRICKSQELNKINDNLETAFYGLVSAAGSDLNKALKKSQADWLDRRNSCGDKDRCIMQRYNSRLHKLQELMELRGDGLLDKAAFLCANPNDTSIDHINISKTKDIVLDINNDGIDEVIAPREYGCGMGEGQKDCFEVRKNGKYEKVRFSETFVNGYSFAKYDGSVFVFGYSDSGHNKLIYIGVVSNNNVETPICSFHDDGYRIPFEPNWM